MRQALDFYVMNLIIIPVRCDLTPIAAADFYKGVARHEKGIGYHRQTKPPPSF